MRLNLKIALCLLTVGTFFTTLSYWSRCGESGLESGNRLLRKTGASVALFSRGSSSSAARPIRYGINTKDEVYRLENEDKSADSLVVSAAGRDDDESNTEEIDCLINNDYTVPCRRDAHEVYVPFTFLRKYFEVYGKLASAPSGSSKESRPRFEWQHSYSKYYVPHAKYDPRGAFMNFANFNVEARDRVKCINAVDGVPVSMQWDVRGYLYPIQIAQFGLSHFSKNLTEPEPRSVVHEDGGSRRGRWAPAEDEYPAERERGEGAASGARSAVERSWDADASSMVMSFDSPDGLLLRLDQVPDLLVLSVDVRLENNDSSVTVDVEDRDRKASYRVHYVRSDASVWTDYGRDIYYGVGASPPNAWKRLTRDLAVDVRKGLQAAATKGNPQQRTRAAKPPAKLRLVSVTVRGKGSLDNLTVSSSAHLRHFFDAADWLTRNQDERGGWPIPVERRFGAGGMAALAPGWYSAMAQGQAMSVLTRAYRATGERRYLGAAEAAAEPLRVASSEGGVAARFLDRYTWYEEYPTTPASFVLNGFVYALIGLYDARACCEDRCETVGRLYEEGVAALKALLPLFDSGATSMYDLRHFTVGLAPNLARWDYHTTHIGQLLLMGTVDDGGDSQILNATAKRWIEYMKGKRAPHN